MAMHYLGRAAFNGRHALGAGTRYLHAAALCELSALHTNAAPRPRCSAQISTPSAVAGVHGWLHLGGFKRRSRNLLPMAAGGTPNSRSMSTDAVPFNRRSLSWIFASPLWRAVVGGPLLASNVLMGALMFAMGPGSFFKTLDRSTTVFPPVMDELESRLVEGNGIRLHVVATPPVPGKPLLLFLHGFPEFWYSWRHQLRHFSARYQVAAMDMRGYNLSDKPQGVASYTVDQVASDIPGVVRSLGHKSCTLVGHDWGGCVAWGAAALYPEVIDKVAVLSVPPAGQLVRNMFPRQAIRSSYMLLATLYPRLYELLFPAHDFDALRSVFNEVGYESMKQEDLERYKQALGRPGAVQATLAYYTALFSITAQEPENPMNKRVLEGRVTQPALQLYPEDEKYIMPETFEGLEEFVPRLQLRRVPGGHFAHHQCPAAFNAALDAWLEEH